MYRHAQTYKASLHTLHTYATHKNMDVDRYTHKLFWEKKKDIIVLIFIFIIG